MRGSDRRDEPSAASPDARTVTRLRKANASLQGQLQAALRRAEVAERRLGSSEGTHALSSVIDRFLGPLRSKPTSSRLPTSRTVGVWVNPRFAEDPPQANDLIAFFHAQRTGGSALRHLFADALGPDAVYCTQFSDDFRHWNEVSASALAEKRVFAGHSAFEPREIGRRLRPVTLVRHPFFRTVSLYYYCKKYPNQFLHDLTHGRDVRAFYEVASARKPAYFHDVMCRRIVGKPSCDAALSCLSERFLAVGATERLGEFVRWLFGHEGLSVPEVPVHPADSERYAEHLNDQDFYAQVMAANAEDARLFETLNAAGLDAPSRAVGPAGATRSP